MLMACNGPMGTTVILSREDGEESQNTQASQLEILRRLRGF
jgi:hypothetical protein